MGKGEDTEEGGVSMKRVLTFICFMVIVLAWTGWCSGKAKGGPGAKKPITVTSQKMEAHAKEGWVLFIGKVRAVQGDLTLYTDRLQVFIARKGGKVERILAQGHVKVERGDKVILSDRAEYRLKDGVVEFTGHPKAWEGKNLVLGEKMLYYPKEDKSVVVGGKGRVNAVIYPEGELKHEVKGPGPGKKLQK